MEDVMTAFVETKTESDQSD